MTWNCLKKHISIMQIKRCIMLKASNCKIGIVKLNVHELEYLLYLFEIAILIHSYMLQCVVDERIWNYGKKKIDLDIWHQSKYLLCCFHKIGYINKIVYRRSLYIRTSMFQRCVPRVINCVSCKLWLLPFDFFPLIAWYNFLRHCRKKTSLQ